MDHEHKPCLVNFHIPRTGGRTRTRFLSDLVGNQNIFHTMGPEKREFTEYLQMSAQEKSEIRLISGHMPFLFMAAVAKPKFCITFLRNPIYRSISHYNGFKSWEGHPICELIHKNNLSVGDFLLSGIRNDIYDNVMVRYFLEEPPEFMEIGRKHLEEAKKNLDTHIDFVGLTEQSELCLNMIGQIFGSKKRLEVPHVGNMKQQRKMAGLTPYDIQALHKVNEYDLEFFDYAVGIFKKQTAKYTDDSS